VAALIQMANGQVRYAPVQEQVVDEQVMDQEAAP
jgi:hypothetical protein